MKATLRKIRNAPEYRKINHVINTSMCLGSLGLAQVLKGTIVAAFPTLLPLFFTVQFFGSTIQGSFSDIYKRSIVLNFALILFVATLLLLTFSHGHEGSFFRLLDLACITLIGFGGNADVVGRAEIVDIHYHADRRKIMSWTVFSEAFSWVVIGGLIRFLSLDPFNILVICIPFAVLLLIISLLFNSDKTQDKKHLRNVFNELKIIVKENKLKLILLTQIIIAGECGYFFFFYSQETPIKDPNILADSYMAWFLGMSLGCWILSKSKKPSDFSFLIFGIIVSFFSVLLFILGGMKGISIPKMFYFDSLTYFIAGLGSGFYLPCFYSIISRGHSIHFQGALTGWIDSLRVFGDAVTNAALLGIAFLPQFIPIFISGFLFLLTISIILISKKHIC